MDAPPTAAPRAATAVAVTAWGLAACSSVLLLGARPPLTQDLWFYAVDVAVALVYGLVAAVVLRRRRHPAAWLLAVAAVGGGVAAVGFAYGALAAAVGGLPAEELLRSLSGTAWLPGTFALFLVVPWLVREEAEGRRGALERLGLRAGVAVTAGMTVVALLPDLPAAFAAYLVLTAAAVVLGLLTAWACLRRGRAVPDGERSGYRWLALGTAIIAVRSRRSRCGR